MQDKMEEKIMIAPSIMCISEWHDTKNIFRQLKENGIAMIHADVMDGKFVPNLMLGTESIKHLREVTDIPLDIHMMVENPKKNWIGLIFSPVNMCLFTQKAQDICREHWQRSRIMGHIPWLR